jgi:acyl-CoA synthetase (AMP-forming)/AMP-acid ligase II
MIAAGRAIPDHELDAIARTLKASDAINIQYTSGTTGFPKAAMLTHRNILMNAWYVTELQAITENDRMCVQVPFYHCFGCVMGSLGAIVRGAWVHTGDLAVRRADGCYKIAGRLKDMVIRGGENIYPREIEEFLFTHPAVAQAAVLGVPDPKYGEELCVWVQLRPGHTATADDIRAFCRENVAHYKVPRYVKFVTEFPTTVSGKIQKFKMREIMCAELNLKDQVTA